MKIINERETQKQQQQKKQTNKDRKEQGRAEAVKKGES